VDLEERFLCRRRVVAFDAVLERFVKESPVSVMARLVLQRAVSAEWVDSLFEEHRERQYTRELLFSTVVELMSVVARRRSRSRTTPGDGRLLILRRIEFHLDEPTEEGDTVIRLLTNAPAEKVSAEQVACLYRKHWSIEGMFQSLESALHSEVRTLGQPRAALLAFGTAVVAYNILAVIQAAMEAAHPEAQAQGIEFSPFFVATEVKATYGGMMIAVAASLWTAFEEQSPLELSRPLVRIAKHAQPKRLRKHPRAPKKKVKKGYVAGRTARRHVSTARVLASGRIDSTS
jgi:hypothetical protein